MNFITNEPIKRRLLLLAVVLIASLAAIVAIQSYFRYFSQKCDMAIDNQMAHRRMGRVIIRKLLEIEKNTSKTLATDNIRNVHIFEEQVSSSIGIIQSVLGILQNGGAFTDILPANINDKDEIKEEYSYWKEGDAGYVIEIIDLTPKIIDIEELSGKFFSEVQKRLNSPGEEQRQNSNSNVQLYSKQMDTFLLRSRENATKIFYESHQEIQRLKQYKKDAISRISQIRYLVILAIVISGVVLFVVVFRQIGKIIKRRKQAEKKLEEYRDQLEELVKERTAELDQIFNTAADAMRVVDKEFNMIRVNQTFADLVGLTKEEIVNKRCYDVFSNPLCHTENCPLSMILADPSQRVESETETQVSDGSNRYCLLTATAFCQSNDEVIGIVEGLKDITERKQAEEKIKDAEEKFRTLYESTVDAVMLLDEKGFFDCNRAAVRIFGCKDKAEFCSKHPADLSPGTQPNGTDSMEYARNNIEVALKEGSYRFEHLHRRLDDTEFPAEVLLNALELNGKKVLQAVVRDITERKSMESQLRQAEKMQSIGQLASGVAHEINTPIQYIGDNINFLQDSLKDILKLLSEYEQVRGQAVSGTVDSKLLCNIQDIMDEVDIDYLTEEVPRAIEESLEGVGNVSRIVQAMKEFAHTGTQEKISADLNQAIGSTVTVTRNQWKYTANLETDFDPELPSVTCRVDEFNQVILNLIVNAADAITEKMGEGSGDKGTITISTRQDEDWVEIRVADTGTGIPEENHGRVLDPFFTTKEVGKGSGQGLAIVHSIIVDKHGGTLTFETELGKGTTFIIRLPIEQDMPSGDVQDEETYSIY